jgi:hypothetical protein
MNFYRLGTNARVVVPCDPSLISLQTGIITQQVSWDFNDGVLQPYVASAPSDTITSLTPTYNGNGTWTIAIVASASLVGAVGDTVDISGVTGTGNAYVNGTQTVVAYTSSTQFSILVAAPSGAISGLTGGSLVYGGGALPVRVLDVQVGNSMTVNYSSTTGFATWNRSGTTALILI